MFNAQVKRWSDVQFSIAVSSISNRFIHSFVENSVEPASQPEHPRDCNFSFNSLENSQKGKAIFHTLDVEWPKKNLLAAVGRRRWDGCHGHSKAHLSNTLRMATAEGTKTKEMGEHAWVMCAAQVYTSELCLRIGIVCKWKITNFDILTGTKAIMKSFCHWRVTLEEEKQTQTVNKNRE